MRIELWDRTLVYFQQRGEKIRNKHVVTTHERNRSQIPRNIGHSCIVSQHNSCLFIVYVVYLTMLSVSQAIQHRMVIWLVNNKLKWMWKVVVHFPIICVERLKYIANKLSQEWSVEIWTEHLRIKVRNVSAWPRLLRVTCETHAKML